MSNDFFAENEIQIRALGEDEHGIFVSFISSVCCFLDAGVYFINLVWHSYETVPMHVF